MGDFMKKEILNLAKKQPVTMILLGINVLVFLLTEFTGRSNDAAHMLAFGAAQPALILEEGQWYRLFTCMFLHFGIEHLLNNMLVLCVLGIRLEPILGRVKFLLIYLIGGIGGNIVSLVLAGKESTYSVSAGASGAVFSLMGAILYIVLRHRGRVRDLTARQVAIMAVLSLYLGFASSGVDNAAHVGGFCFGFLLAVLLYRPAAPRPVVKKI